MKRSERAAGAAVVPVGALLGASASAWGLNAAEIHGADARFVAVLLGALLPLWAGRAVRPRSRPRMRAAVVALGLPALGLLVGVLGSGIESASMVPFVSWLSGGALLLGLDAVVYAGWTASRLGVGWSRAAYALIGGGPGLYFWAAMAVVVVNTQLLIAPVRLGHLASNETDGERAMSLETADGLTVKLTETPAKVGAPGVVLVHGVADSRRRMAPLAMRLAERGAWVVRIDLRGHGRSDGSVVTYGQREAHDVLAAVRHLRRAGAAPIHVIGTSMGGGVLMAAAPQLQAAGVERIVAMAPASDYPPLVQQRVALLGPLAPPVLRGSAVLARWMGQTPMTHWRPREGLARSTLPVLVLHGTADDVIDLALSEALGDRVDLVRLPGVGHVDIPLWVAEDEATWARVTAFLTE
ncbi:MAG: alpha/beta hydrolase [Sandaracinaceae bacterium]